MKYSMLSNITYFRKVASSERYFAKMRNVIALTFTLGLGFVVGFLPVLSSNDPSQVIGYKKQRKINNPYFSMFLSCLIR